MDVKKLGVVVEQKGIAPTAKNLERLAKASESAQQPLERLSSTLGSFKTVNLDSFSAKLQDTTQAIKDVKASTSGMADMAKNIGGLSVNLTNIANATERLSAKTADVSAYVAQLKAMRTELEGMKGLSANIGRTSTGGARGTSGGSGSPTYDASSTNALTAAQQRLMTQLERTALMVGKTKSEYLAARAAQLGLTDSATPFIAKIKESEKAMNGMTISTKQANAAMRMVPAQFTDIVTQLAGGQNPFLIMLQQGGQMRDMFQGFGNMFKAVGPMILNFVTNPFVLAAAAIGTFTYGFIKASSEISEFNKAMAASNGVIGLSTQAYYDMRDAITKTGMSRTEAVTALTEIAKSGQIAAEDVLGVAKASIQMSKITGGSIKEAVAVFAELRDKPLDTLTKLDKSMNFLSYSTKNTIKDLVEQGKTAEATALAIKALEDAMNSMSTKSKAGLEGTTKLLDDLKKAVDRVGAGFASMFDFSDKKQVATLDRQIAAKQAQIDALGASPNIVSNLRVKQLQSELDALAQKKQKIKDVLAAEDNLKKKEAERVGQEKKQKEARSTWEKSVDNLKTQSEKQKEINKANEEYNNLKKLGIATDEDAANLKERLKKIDKDYQDKDAARAQNKLDALKKELSAAQGLLQVEVDKYAAMNLSALGAEKQASAMAQVYKYQRLMADSKVSPEVRDNAKQQAAIYEQVAAMQKLNNETKQALEIQQKIDTQTATNIDMVANAKEAYDLERASIAMTTKEKAAMLAAYEIEIQKQKKIIELNAELAKAPEAQKQAWRDLIEDTKQAYSIKADFAKQQNALNHEELSWTTNLETAARQYSQNLGTYNQQVQSGFMSMFSSVESALTSFVTGTKFSFKDLMTSVLKNLAVMFAKIALMKVAMAGIGLLGFGSSGTTAAGPSVAAGGGTWLGGGQSLSLASAKGNAFTSTGVAKFAQGGAFTNKIYNKPTPIAFAQGAGFSAGVIGEKAGSPGEAVMPLSRMSNGNLGVETSGKGGNQYNVGVTVNMNGDGTSTTTTSSDDKTSAKAMGDLIARKVKETIVEQKRPGGLLATR